MAKIEMVKTVANILKLSQTHFVSTISHQHQSNLRMIRISNLQVWQPMNEFICRLNFSSATGGIIW